MPKGEARHISTFIFDGNRHPKNLMSKDSDCQIFAIKAWEIFSLVDLKYVSIFF